MPDFPTSFEGQTTEPPAQDAPDKPEGPSPETATKDAQPDKAKGPAPWHKDLEEMGLEPELFEKFDGYLRSKIQPHTTHLEQQLKGYSDIFPDHETAGMVAQLVNALEEDPTSMLLRLAQAYDERIDHNGFQSQYGSWRNPDGPQPSTDEQEPTNTDVSSQLKSLLDQDPRMQQLEQYQQQLEEQAQMQAYQEVLDHLTEQIPGFNSDLFTMVVRAQETDDLDEALAEYMKFHREPEPTPKAPPTSGDSKGVTPREANKPRTIEEAAKWMGAEIRAAQG